MRIKLLMLVAAMLVFGSLSWAKTITGTVSDSMCGAKHATASADAAACVKKCEDGGAKLVVVSDGKVYSTDEQDQLKGHVGVPDVAHPDALEPEVFPADILKGIDLHLSAGLCKSCRYAGPSRSSQRDAFGHGIEFPGHLEGHIHALSMGDFQDGLSSLLLRELLPIQRQRGPEGSAHLEPLLGPSDGDNLGSGQGLCKGNRKNPEGSDALDQDGISGLRPRKIDGMGRRCSRAGGRNEGLEVNARIDPEKIDPPIHGKIFGVISGEVGRSRAGGMDAVDPAIGAQRRLHLHLAKVTVAARHSSTPEDLVSCPKRCSVNILLLAIQFRNLSYPFVAENHGEADTRVSSFPLVDIRPADPCCLDLDEDLALFQPWDRKGLEHQGFIKFFEDHRPCIHKSPKNVNRDS